MGTLREIKDRLISVRKAGKMTSAMKLVASSNLRKAQSYIGKLRPYEEALREMISSVGGVPASEIPEGAPEERLALVAVSSNNSLCGSFNSNLIKYALSEIEKRRPVAIWSIGRKMTEALRHNGLDVISGYDYLSGKVSFEDSAPLSRILKEKIDKGEYTKIIIVHGHMVSASVQKPVSVQFLPLVPDTLEDACEDDVIIEPGRSEFLAEVLPQYIDIRFYASLLDAAVSEHSSRMIAMQMAADNADELRQQLNLEYNKKRQQKITEEILDLVGGSAVQ